MTVVVTGVSFVGCHVVRKEDTESLFHRQSHGRLWRIDSLDGTKEFIVRNGEFTANITLIEDLRCMLAVVYAPAIGKAKRVCMNTSMGKNGFGVQ